MGKVEKAGTITAAEMRALERRAIAAGEVDGATLMERAGRAVVEAVLAEWPSLARGARVAEVLCGPGNNGGDGYVVARLLADRGWRVAIWPWGDHDALTGDAAAARAAWLAVAPDAPPTDVPTLQVDALFGIGLSRPIDDPVLWEKLWLLDDAVDTADLPGAHFPGPDAPPRTVAVDLPSGLDADTGAVLGGAPAHGVRAAAAMLTVTFHRPKPCHVAGPDHALCGKVVVADIGL